MHESSTLNDLILYYFNETDMSNSVLTQKAIDNDLETEEEYKNIVKTMHYIEKAMVDPSAKSVDSILNYSRSLRKTSV